MMAPAAPVAILCGGGSLPAAIAESVRKRGGDAVIFAFKGTEPDRIAAYRHHWIAVGQAGRLLGLMRSEGCKEVVFVGTMTRPAVRDLRLDLGTLIRLPRILAAFRGGDDHLLSGLAKLFEAEGIAVRGVSDVASDLVMPTGPLTARTPDDAELDDIRKARAALHALSPYDVGQAAVCIDGHVVAIEDIGGTDELLRRIVSLRDRGRLRTPPGRGVLVKAPKVTQDLRYDLPAIGPTTVEGVAAAGLAGIAITAGRALVADPGALIASAKQKNIFVVGTADLDSAELRG